MSAFRTESGGVEPATRRRVFLFPSRCRAARPFGERGAGVGARGHGARELARASVAVRTMTMTDEALLAAQREKGRSASICAPGISSMEVFLSGIPPPGTPPLDAAAAAGTGTPRRRRPATRSQSARLTGGKSVRRRALNAELAGSNQSMRSGGSEPRLEQASKSFLSSNALLNIPVRPECTRVVAVVVFAGSSPGVWPECRVAGV